MGERERRFGDQGLTYTALADRMLFYKKILNRIEEEIRIYKKFESELIQQKDVTEREYKKLQSREKKRQMEQELKDIRDILTKMLRDTQPWRDGQEEVKRRIVDLEHKFEKALKALEIPEA